MKSKASSLQLGLFLLGVLILIIGNRLSIPTSIFIGVLCFGLVCLIAGIQMIVTRHANFFTRTNAPHENYTGLPAQLWGVLFLLLAMLFFILALAGLFLPGGEEAFWELFLNKPMGWGVLLLLLGTYTVVYGIIRLMAGSAVAGTGFIAGVNNLGGRFLGGLSLLFGLGLVLFGLALIIAPGVLAAIFNNFVTGVLR